MLLRKREREQENKNDDHNDIIDRATKLFTNIIEESNQKLEQDIKTIRRLVEEMSTKQGSINS